MEGADGPQRAGVRLPVEITQRQARDQTRSEQLVDIVGIEVLDCSKGRRSIGLLFDLSVGAIFAPVTLEVENGCSMLDSARGRGLWHDPRARLRKQSRLLQYK